MYGLYLGMYISSWILWELSLWLVNSYPVLILGELDLLEGLNLLGGLGLLGGLSLLGGLDLLGGLNCLGGLDLPGELNLLDLNGLPKIQSYKFLEKALIPTSFNCFLSANNDNVFELSFSKLWWATKCTLGNNWKFFDSSMFIAWMSLLW